MQGTGAKAARAHHLVPPILAALLLSCSSRGPQVGQAPAPPPPAAPRPVDAADQDGDGDRARGAGGNDCDDQNPKVHSGAAEVCDGWDNDCDGKVDGGPLTLCRALTLVGEHKQGELGFRFGPPRDVDGDGIADIAAGQRFTTIGDQEDIGYAGVWSGADGHKINSWIGPQRGSLFGGHVMLGHDMDGDGLSDVFIAAPGQEIMQSGQSVRRGMISVRSPRSGKEITRFLGAAAGAAFAWHQSFIEDLNGDGVPEIIAGETGNYPVRLLDGKSGALLQSYGDARPEGTFGWFVVPIADMDGDGKQDVLISAPSWVAREKTYLQSGAVFLYGSLSGKRLHAYYGPSHFAMFGESIDALPDLDGDGKPELVVSISNDPEGKGAAVVLSAVDGRQIHRFVGTEKGEMYGRMVANVGDIDGDGVADIAIGAPHATVDGKTLAGRFDLRSGKTGQILISTAGIEAHEMLGWHIQPARDLLPSRARGVLVHGLQKAGPAGPGCGEVVFFALGR